MRLGECRCVQQRSECSKVRLNFRGKSPSLHGPWGRTASAIFQATTLPTPVFHTHPNSTHYTNTLLTPHALWLPVSRTQRGAPSLASVAHLRQQLLAPSPQLFRARPARPCKSPTSALLHSPPPTSLITSTRREPWSSRQQTYTVSGHHRDSGRFPVITNGRRGHAPAENPNRPTRCGSAEGPNKAQKRRACRYYT